MLGSRERVPASTPWWVNRRIHDRTREAVIRAVEGGRESIDQRLRALDREWDIDRSLFMWAPLPLTIGLALGWAVNRRYLVLPAIVASFLALHAISGWCPPGAVLRRRGVRTRDEINDERLALKALRGDFRALAGVDQVLANVEA